MEPERHEGREEGRREDIGDTHEEDTWRISQQHVNTVTGARREKIICLIGFVGQHCVGEGDRPPSSNTRTING